VIFNLIMLKFYLTSKILHPANLFDELAVRISQLFSLKMAV